MAIGGLIFAVLMLLRVVEPYHGVAREGEQAKEALESAKTTLLEQQERLGAVERALQEIERELEEEPWNAEKQKLIKYFEERNSGGSGELAVPQEKANETIENIVQLVESRVIEKLRKVTAGTEETSERLANYPDRIQLAVNNWRNANYNNTRWFFTPESKNETISGMSAVLSKLKTEALEAVAESRSGLEERQAEIADRDAAIERQIANATMSIKDELDKILPVWAQDSVGVKSMMVFYPWLIVLLVASVVGKAVIAARHFHGMADEEQWTAEERSDPLLSSPWTLTWRGVTGTVATVLTYSSVILVFAFCLHRALNPSLTGGSGTGDNTTVADSSRSLADAVAAILPESFAYVLLLVAFAVVVSVSVRRGVRSIGTPAPGARDS